MVIRNMKVYASPVSSIDHVAVVPEVQRSLAKWIEARLQGRDSGVLIGGLAMSFYARPRHTTDVDLLFLAKTNIPEAVPGFRRYRQGAFEDTDTGVDIEVTTPESFKSLPSPLARKVAETAINHGKLLVASREGMIALKLVGADTPKREMKDLADVVSLLDNHLSITMDRWYLTENQLKNFELCKSKLK